MHDHEIGLNECITAFSLNKLFMFCFRKDALGIQRRLTCLEKLQSSYKHSAPYAPIPKGHRFGFGQK
jgi:hypothetical protein